MIGAAETEVAAMDFFVMMQNDCCHVLKNLAAVGIILSAVEVLSALEDNVCCRKL